MVHPTVLGMAKPRTVACFAALLLLVPPTTYADTIDLVASRDTTIYKDVPANSNGAGQGMFAGEDARGSPRRALIGFDIAGSIPAGAIITSVQLKLFLDEAAPADSKARQMDLHRLLADWGEGTTGKGMSGARSGEGFATPTNGTAATWSHRFYNTVPWTTAGGDFLAAVSGSTMVGKTRQTYTWDSTPDMVSDVQDWLDDPASNLGWILLGDETAATTARRFFTREAPNAVDWPTLEVTFSATAVPEPSTLVSLVLGSLGLLSFLRPARRSQN